MLCFFMGGGHKAAAAGPPAKGIVAEPLAALE